jgi:hypothetical protein
VGEPVELLHHARLLAPQVGEQGLHRGGLVLEQRDQHVLLAFEVAVERALGVARLGADVVDREVTPAAAGE